MRHIIIGMHRSGTSLVARILHENGYSMGDDKHFMPEPDGQNPYGYYEDRRFRDINDSILKSVAYDVKSWNTSIPTPSGNKSLRGRIRGVLAQSDGGFKDPRFSLTWQVWEPYLKGDTTLVFVFRNPISVANSLIKRGNISNIEHGLHLWETYNQRAYLATKHFPTIFVNYESLMREKIIPNLGIDCSSYIDYNLNHNVEEQSSIKLWNKLKMETLI